MGNAASPLEIEIKLHMRDLLPLNQSRLKVYEVTPRHFEDNWLLDTADQTLRKSGSALRVRFANGSGTVTFKAPSQPDLTYKVREEIESPISDPDAMIEIFRRMGYEKAFRYQKYRTILRLDLEDGRSLAAMFDETPLGNFLELEGGREEITAVAEELGFSTTDYITKGYVTLQYEFCNMMGQQFCDMIFAQTEAAG
jgi:adenylate cyclase class 2